jgi:starch phosphorylase
MLEQVGEDNIYIFGKSSEEIIHLYDANGYNSRHLYEQDSHIRACVDFIISDKLLNIGSSESLHRLHNELVNKDWFMTLLDFNSYVRAKEQAFKDYQNRDAWAEKMITNIGKAGYFSSDRTIGDYNRDIWKLI